MNGDEPLNYHAIMIIIYCLQYVYVIKLLRIEINRNVQTIPLQSF